MALRLNPLHSKGWWTRGPFIQSLRTSSTTRTHRLRMTADRRAIKPRLRRANNALGRSRGSSILGMIRSARTSKLMASIRWLSELVMDEPGLPIIHDEVVVSCKNSISLLFFTTVRSWAARTERSISIGPAKRISSRECDSSTALAPAGFATRGSSVQVWAASGRPWKPSALR